MLFSKFFFLLTTTSIVAASELYIRAAYANLNTEDLLQVRDEDSFAREELYRREELLLEPRTPLDNLGLVETRDTKGCSNKGRLRNKNKYPNCQPDQSRGIASAHNCKSKGGKAYLCVQSGVATCLGIKEAFDKHYEGGECFL